MKKGIPEKGDIININIDEGVGLEMKPGEKGTRYALVVSEYEFNQKGLCFVALISNGVGPKTYPNLKVTLTGHQTTGSVFPSYVRSIDFKIRGAKFVEKADSSVVEQFELMHDAILGR